jgi:hypothetical protein
VSEVVSVWDYPEYGGWLTGFSLQLFPPGLLKAHSPIQKAIEVVKIGSSPWSLRYKHNMVVPFDKKVARLGVPCSLLPDVGLSNIVGDYYGVALSLGSSGTIEFFANTIDVLVAVERSIRVA